jgi:hypothetical protein
MTLLMKLERQNKGIGNKYRLFFPDLKIECPENKPHSHAFVKDGNKRSKNICV